jgi:hypothetical protein
MKNTSNWKLYLVLTSASILSVVAVLPYAFTLAGDILKQAPFPLPVLMKNTLSQKNCHRTLSLS